MVEGWTESCWCCEGSGEVSDWDVELDGTEIEIVSPCHECLGSGVQTTHGFVPDGETFGDGWG